MVCINTRESPSSDASYLLSGPNETTLCHALCFLIWTADPKNFNCKDMVAPFIRAERCTRDSVVFLGSIIYLYFVNLNCSISTTDAILCVLISDNKFRVAKDMAESCCSPLYNIIPSVFRGLAGLFCHKCIKCYHSSKNIIFS